MNHIAISDIQRATEYHFGIEAGALVAPGRARKISFPRQIAMYLSRELTKQSLPQIGGRFGGRDHSTVLHAIVKVRDRKQEPEIAASLAHIRARARVLSMARTA